MTTFWEKHNPEAIITKCRFDAKEFKEELIELKPITRELIKDKNILDVPISPREGAYHFVLDSRALAKYSNVCFFDQDKMIAKIECRAGKCELVVMQSEHPVNVRCMFEGDALSIKSPGEVNLFGNIKNCEEVSLDCNECHIKEWGTVDTSIQTRRMVVRSTQDITLDKNVIINTDEQIYFSGKNICNNASFSTHDAVLAVENFTNAGEISVSQDITGFTLGFNNSGKMKAGHLLSVITNNYTDSGETEAGILNVQTQEASVSGKLTTQKEGLILAEKKLYFHESAILENHANFSVECDGDIQFDATLRNVNPNKSQERTENHLRIVAGKELNFAGDANIENSNVVIKAKEKLNIEGKLGADNKSDLLLESDSIEMNDNLFDFRSVNAAAKKHLTINQPFQATENVCLNAEQIDINAAVKSKKTFDLHAQHVNVNEDGRMLSEEQGQVICDDLHNAGDIISQNGLYCGVNYLTCNTGNISAKSLNVDTAIYANLGYASGETSMKVNALVSLSAGITSAGQYQNNSLLELKTGLHLTQLPELSDLFSMNSLLECGKLVAKNMVPQIYQALQFISQAYGWLKPLVMNGPSEVYNSLIAIWASTISQLKEIATQLQEKGLATVQLHRLIGGMAQMKDKAVYLNSSLHQWASLKDAEANVLRGVNELKSLLDSEYLQHLVQEINPNNAVNSVITALTPGYSSDSLVSLCSGGVITAHCATRSLHMHNSAFHAALTSLSISSKNLTNTGGLFAGGEVALSGLLNESQFRDEGVVAGKTGVRANFSDITLASEYGLLHSNWNVKADHCAIENNQEFKSSNIKTKSFICEAGSVLGLTQSGMTAENLFQQHLGSELNAEQSSIHAGDIEFKTKTTLVHSTAHAERNLDQSGDLVGDKATLEGETVRLQNATLEDGQVRAQALLQTNQVTTQGTALSAHDMELQDSKFEGQGEQPTITQLHATGKIAAKKVQFDGVAANAVNMDLQETTAHRTAILAEENIAARNFTADQSQVVAGDIYLKGQTDARESSIKSLGDFTLSGEVTTQDTTLAAKNMTIDSHIQSKKHLNVEVEEHLQTTKASRIAAETLSMKANVFEHEGKISTTGAPNRKVDNSKMGFSLEANQLFNSWNSEFDVRGESFFDVKYILVNYGKMNGDTMKVNAGIYANLAGWSHTNRLTINAGLFANFVGDIAGNDSLTVNSGLTINGLGVMRSLHIHTSSLATIGVALYVPAIPSTWSELFSWDTLCGVGTTLLHNVAPTMGSALGTAKTIYSLGNSGKTLINSATKLGKQAWSDPKSVNMGEVVGMLVGIKDLVDGANGLVDSAKGMINSAKEQEAKNKAEAENKKEAEKNGSANNEGSTAEKEKQESISYTAFFKEKGKEFCSTVQTESSKLWTAVKELPKKVEKKTPTDHKTSNINKVMDIESVKEVDGVKEVAAEKPCSGWKTLKTAVGTETATMLKGAKKIWNRDVTKSEIQSAAYQTAYHTAMACTAQITPSISTDAIYQNNTMGLMLSGNISERAVWADNKFSAQCGAVKVSSVTYKKENSGLIVGNSVSISSDQFTNQNIVFARNFTGDITHTVNDGRIGSVKFQLEGNSYSGNGIKAQEANIKLDDWHQTGGETDFASGVMDLKNLTEADGSMDLKKMNAKVENSLQVGSAAKMNITQSHLQAGKTEVQGKGTFTATESQVDVKSYQSTATSQTHLTKSRLQSETAIEMNGKVDLAQSDLKAAGQATFASDAKMTMTDALIEAETIKMATQAEVHGENLLVAKKRLDTEKSSSMSGDGKVGFKAAEGSLKGKFTANGAAVEIDKLDGGVEDLLYGRNASVSFQPTEFLSVKTPDAVNINHAWERECQVELTAAGIDVNASVNMKKGLRLETTRDDLKIGADITAQKTIELKSAKNIVNQQAKVISKEKLLLETVQGDLRNVGGTLQGENYLEANINGNVYNTADETTTQGRTQYIPAQMLGGQRKKDGIGLLIKSTGKVINDASIMQSKGHNVVHAKQGFEGRARTETYVSERTEKKGFLGWNGQKREVTTTDVSSSSMVSTHGRNVVNAEEGGIKSNGSSFISKEGTDLFARDDINLRGVKAKHQVTENKHSFFGLVKNNKCEKHETTTPTVLFDLGNSNIRSHKGNIDAVDTKMLGPGHLHMKAKNVRVASSIENHSTDTHSRSLNVNLFGLAAIQAVATGQDLVIPLISQDPTLANVDNLLRHSNSAAETAANVSNTALSAYNTFQTLNSAHGAGNLGTALLQRYGVGDSSGFNPTISIGLTDAASHQDYQTLGPGAIQRGSVEIEATHKVSIDGARVDVAGDMSVTAEVLEQNGVELRSNFTSEAGTVSVGITPKGGITSVSVGYQNQEGHQVDQHTQKLHVGGKLTVNANSWKMNNATADVGSIGGHVNELIATSTQSTASSSSVGLQASSTGFVSVAFSDSQSAITREKAGITVHNSAGSDLTIGRASLTAAEIRTADPHGIKIGEVRTQTVKDSERGHRVGFAGNIHDILPAQRTDDAQDSSPMIPTVGLQYGLRDYQATQDETGKTVLADREMNLHVDIPIIPREKFESAAQGVANLFQTKPEKTPAPSTQPLQPVTVSEANRQVKPLEQSPTSLPVITESLPPASEIPSDQKLSPAPAGRVLRNTKEIPQPSHQATQKATQNSAEKDSDPVGENQQASSSKIDFSDQSNNEGSILQGFEHVFQARLEFLEKQLDSFSDSHLDPIDKAANAMTRTILRAPGFIVGFASNYREAEMSGDSDPIKAALVKTTVQQFITYQFPLPIQLGINGTQIIGKALEGLLEKAYESEKQYFNNANATQKKSDQGWGGAIRKTLGEKIEQIISETRKFTSLLQMPAVIQSELTDLITSGIHLIESQLCSDSPKITLESTNSQPPHNPVSIMAPAPISPSTAISTALSTPPATIASATTSSEPPHNPPIPPATAIPASHPEISSTQNVPTKKRAEKIYSDHTKSSEAKQVHSKTSTPQEIKKPKPAVVNPSMGFLQPTHSSRQRDLKTSADTKPPVSLSSNSMGFFGRSASSTVKQVVIQPTAAAVRKKEFARN